MAKETAMTKVAWRGVNITARMRDMNRWVERKMQAEFPGFTMLPAQGSWNSKVNASGTTHAGAGAEDIRTVMLPANQRKRLIFWMKKAGFACWFRPPNWDGNGGGEHVHALDQVTNGESPSAKWQVGQYNKGMNGLTNAKKDPTFRVKPPVRWSYPLGKPVTA